MIAAGMAGAGARKRAAARSAGASNSGGAMITADGVAYRKQKRADVRAVAQNNPAMIEIVWNFNPAVGLAGSGARVEDLTSLAEALVNNTHLQTISLVGVKVFGDSKAKLLKSMKKCKVCHIDFTDAGVNVKDQAKFRQMYVKYACERLSQNDPALLELNWPASRISDDEMAPLAKALSKNTNLIHLNLNGNRPTKAYKVGVTSAGAQHLIKVLPATGICSIDLRQTEVGKKELDVIDELCLVNDAKLEQLERKEVEVVNGEVRPTDAEDGAVQTTGIVEEGEPPETGAEPEPEAEAAAEPDPQAEPAPEPETELVPEAQPESAPETEAGTEPEGEVEAEPQTEPEPEV